MDLALNLPLAVEMHGPPAGEETPTLLFLHGYGGCAFTWRYWAAPLARRARVVLVDMKGFGSAPKPDDDAYGPGDQAELVHRLIVQRDFRNLTLVGHSLGGGVALLLALRLLSEPRPRLARLVIVAGAAYLQEFPPFVTLAHRPRLMSLLLRLVGARRMVRKVLRSIVFEPEGVSRAQVEGYAWPLSTPPARRALIRSALRIVPDDLDEIVTRYPSIDVPTLLLWGRQDRVVPLLVGERLAATLPDARLEVLERCGHLPPEELPEESLRIVQRFLDETDARGERDS